MTYSIVNIGLGIQTFAENNVYITTILIQEIPTTFPAVTICNTKLTNKTSAKTYIDNLLYVNGTPILTLSSSYGDTYYFSVSQSYYVLSSISTDKNLSTESKKALGYQLSDMILSCQLSCFNWEPCTADDFTLFSHPTYGNCYTFNLKSESNISTVYKKVSVPGPDYGLSMNLFLGKPDKESEYEPYGDGLFVVVHNQGFSPLLNGDRILASAGLETDIKVNRNFVTKLDAPYSKCLKDTTRTSTFTSTYFDYIVKVLGVKYSQQYCYLLCLQEQIVSKCGCALGLLPAYKNLSVCLVSELTCVVDSVIGFNKNGSSDICVNGCPMECDFIEYKVSTSNLLYPNSYYKKPLLQHPKVNASGITYDEIDKATLRFNVFYETMTYTSTQESAAVSTETFLSNLGGTLGLFLGISFLSFVELVELAILLIKAIVEYRFQRKTDRQPVSGKSDIISGLSSVSSTEKFDI